MFKDTKNPTMNELIYWFMIEYSNLVDDMQKSNHAVQTNKPNPFHSGDNSIWTHTMLVCKMAEVYEVPKINRICGLMHDLGKPKAREIVLKDGKERARFLGHEGFSFYLAIEPLKRLQELGVLTEREVQVCLEVIAMHGTLFDNLNSKGEMQKPEKVFSKFSNSKEGLELFKYFITQVKIDSLGRFFISADGRANSARGLETEVFTEQQFLDFYKDKETEDLSELPTLEVLVGVPGSGKSTFLKEKNVDFALISRDDTLMQFAKDNSIEGNYSEVWFLLTDENQKQIDKMLESKFTEAFKNKENIVVDMTNTTSKAKRKWFNKAKLNRKREYRVINTVFATPYNEVLRRLEKREKETGKVIPDFVLRNMIKGFMIPNRTSSDETKWVF